VTYKKYPLISAAGIHLKPIQDRKFGLETGGFAQTVFQGGGLADFLISLPRTGAADDLSVLAARLLRARRRDVSVLLAIGDAAAESGLQPLVIDLMERGWISALAFSWQTAVVDFEIALAGRIIDRNAGDDGYSVTEETGLLLNAGLKEGKKGQAGCGEAIGHFLTQSNFPFSNFSLLYAAYKLNIPVTINPCGGCDPIRMHPHLDVSLPAAMGERDFRLLASIFYRMKNGGIWIQAGRGNCLAGVAVDALRMCRGKDNGNHTLDVAMVMDGPAGDLEKELIALGRESGGWAKRIPGDPSVTIPLLAAMLLNPMERPGPEIEK